MFRRTHPNSSVNKWNVTEVALAEAKQKAAALGYNDPRINYLLAKGVVDKAALRNSDDPHGGGCSFAKSLKTI